MQLDENYSLENTEQQWTLKYSKIYYDEKKKKDVETHREYFHNNLSSALNSYIDKKLKSSESIEDAIMKLQSGLLELKEKGFYLKLNN